MRLLDEPLELPDVPEGLVALPLRQYRRDDQGELVEVRDRSGRRKLDLVALAVAEPAAAEGDDGWPAEVPTGLRGFVLGATRRQWRTIAARLGDEAWPLACALARAGVVRLVCGVDSRLAVGAPHRWELTDAWAAHAAAGRGDRHADRQRWQRRAERAAAALADREPTLAAAVAEADVGGSSGRILVCAAEDVRVGRSHDGPRAFSQAHFAATKTHAHVDTVLRQAGVAIEVRQRLGVHRSQRLGVGGPVTLRRGADAIDVAALDGLVELRADQRDLAVSVDPGVALVVVENLQAGEALCDRHPELAVAYTAGVPGEASLEHLNALAQHAAGVAVAPDADAGGVRIAEAVLGILDAPDVALLDVGTGGQQATSRWHDHGPAVQTLHRALDGPAAALARACLARGYPVEQEATTIAAVETWLRGRC